MTLMFFNCTNLNILNLLDFDFSNISKIEHISYILENCSNLEYINLNNTKLGKNIFDNQTFMTTAKNLVLCSINNELADLQRPECSILDCNDNWREKQKKLYDNQCYDNCPNGTYEYNYKCYDNCPNGTYEYNYKCYDNCPNNIYYKNDKCQECDSKCILCSSSKFCNMCKKGYYILLINETYSYCNESYEGFYLDKKDLFYKSCHSTCKTCKEKGEALKHKCLKCKDNYPFEKIFSDYKNCYNESFNQTKKNEIEQIIKNFQFDLINDFNSSLFDKKINLEMEEKNISIVLTYVYNEKSKERKNETSINLAGCEYKLKEAYPIKNDSLLYILKIEVNETGMKIPKIEYEVYDPLYDNNLFLLNLSVCKNIDIELSIPAYIDDNIEKYNQSSDYYNDICSKTTSKFGTDICLKDRHNQSSDYYNDICSKTTSKFGTDICLKDRQKEFIDNNMTLCEENCYLIEYNNETKKFKMFL